MPVGTLEFLSLVVAWVTMVRWTRDSKDEAVRQLRRQFWIDHSADLCIPTGEGSERAYGNKNLRVRGVEVYDYGWWFDFDSDTYREVSRRRCIYLKSNLFIRKVLYGLYRNFRFGAPLFMNCTLLIEAKNCQISQWGTICHFEGAIGGHGDQLTETFSEIQSFSEVTEVTDSEGPVYKIGLDTYDWYVVDAIINELSKSQFIEEQDVEIPF